MFSDFAQYTDSPAGLMKLMSITNPDFYNIYKEKLIHADEFKSIVVFPEQMIGFNGRLFNVKLHGTSVMASYTDVRGILNNPHTSNCIKSDDDIDVLDRHFYFKISKNHYVNFLIKNEYRFVKRKHAAKFAAKMTGRIFEGFDV